MNLDIIPNGAIKRVHVSQNDVGRTLTFELFNNSTSYTIPTGATVKIQGTKPNGLGFSETCTVNNNLVTVDTTEAMTEVSGNIPTELSIAYNDVVLGTSNFILSVEKNPHPEGTVDGTGDNPIIENLEVIITNAVDAWLDEHPEATTTVVDGSLTEAKFSETLKLKAIKDYVTPEMYGAKGDGVTDDTEAIQNAIDSGKAVLLISTYLTSETIYLYNTSGFFNNLGTITYTGSDYAFSFSGNVDTYVCNLGNVTANNGGCVEISTSTGWKQYITIDFDTFRANTNSYCVLIENETGGNWVNEIAFKNGRFSRGLYAVYCTNTTNTAKGHYKFYNVGFEGVTYGAMLATKITQCYFYGCRCEESVTRMFTSNASAYDALQSVFWHGHLNLTFVDGFNHFKLFIYGSVVLKNGATLNCKSIIVYNNHLYGLDSYFRQRYTGNWLQDESSNYYLDSFENMNTIESASTLVNCVRLPTITADISRATFKIDLNTVIPTEAKALFPSNIIKFLIPIAPSATIIFADSNGTELFSYTSGYSTTKYSLIAEMYYMDNYGLALEVDGSLKIKVM